MLLILRQYLFVKIKMYSVEFQTFPVNKLQERGVFYPFFSDVAYSSMVCNIMQKEYIFSGCL